MIFKQYDDGGGEIVFSDKEVEIFSKTKKIMFDAKAMRDFSNNLFKMCFDTVYKLPEEEKQRSTKSPVVDIKDI
jgi:hypothetical protein